MSNEYILMPLDEVVRKLKSRNISQVARDTGYSRNSIARLAAGHSNPQKVSFGMVEAVQRWLQDH